MVKVLVVEDEASIREMIALNLRRAGMEAVEADSAEAALPLLEQRPGCDAAILDVMLPGMNGFSLCETIRRTDQKIGIIILSAKGQEQDKIRGLSIGADDYMTKPFSVIELVSRVKAVLRRCRPVQQQVLRCGGLAVDTQEHTVTADGVRVELTYKEFQLLRLFLSHMGTAFTRDQLLEQVWGYNFFGNSRTVDVHIKRIREKLPGSEEYGWQIKTVWSVGYKFEVK